MNCFLKLILTVLFLLFCHGEEPLHAQGRIGSPFLLLKTTKAQISTIDIINVFHHDPESFTEGLVFYKGYLYESTGLKGKSALKKINNKSGKIVKEVALGDEFFGEGMTILNNNIYQLTWQNQTGIIYALSTFRKTGTFNYQGEGWGLTTDGKSLIMSNGTSVITFLNPKTFKIIRKIDIKDGEIPVNNLNELEFIRGEIWANVFMEDVIVRFSPLSGKVIGWIDLSQLHKALPVSGRRDVLNGIAYDHENDRIFVTGKFWPILFEIKIQNQR